MLEASFDDERRLAVLDRAEEAREPPRDLVPREPAPRPLVLLGAVRPELFDALAVEPRELEPRELEPREP